jgi:hypothetical protein
VTDGGSTVQIWQNTSPDPTNLEERAVRARLVLEGFEYYTSFILLSELLYNFFLVFTYGMYLM